MRKLLIKINRFKYLTFCTVSSIGQFVLVTIPPSFLGTQIGQGPIFLTIQDIMFWLAPGRIVYKGGGQISLFELQSFLTIVAFNLAGLFFVLSPLYLLNKLFSSTIGK